MARLPRRFAAAADSSKDDTAAAQGPEDFDLDSEIADLVNEEMARRLRALFGALLSVGPEIGPPLADESDPQRAAEIVTAGIVGVIEGYMQDFVDPGLDPRS